MPRPGPRPYECVRRSWHSDRHQPMRGSLIQEIFRVASEVHSPATRKNKVWQEKLPLVVLKAEEIMYSKANSEVEYMDLKTLWARAIDAIDTIIRRDNGAESGVLLHPCIEAALNLGCIPRRASRSQRHSNSRCYLSSSMQEATDASASSLKIPDKNRSQPSSCLQPPQARPSNLYDASSQLAPWYSSLASSTAAYCGLLEVGSVTPLPPRKQWDFLPIPISVCELPTFPSEHFPPSAQGKNMTLPMENYTWPSLGRAYPLYYSTDHQNTESHCSIRDPLGSNHNTVTASSPHVPPIRVVEAGFLQNFLGTSNSLDASDETSNIGGTSENPSDTECDLSLHLGLCSVPCLDVDDAWAHEIEDVGSSSSRDGGKYFDLSPSQMGAKCSFSSSQKEKGWCFFPKNTSNEPLESISSKRSSGRKGTVYLEASDRKRKASVDDSVDYGYFRRKQNQTFFYNRIE